MVACLSTSSAAAQVLEVHGTDDAVVFYEGGQPGGSKTLSAPATFGVWSALNGCEGKSVLDTQALDMVHPPGPETDVLTATGCADGGGSELWSIRGAVRSRACVQLSVY